MRIAILTELYPPSVGGQEVRFAEMARALTRRGHEVSVFCIGHEKGLPAAELVDGVRVRRHPVVADYGRSAIPGLPRSPLAIARYALWCRRVAPARQYDLYLFNQWPLGHVLAARSEVRRRAIIDWCEVRGGRLYGMFERRMPRLTAMNTGVSTAVARGIAQASGREVRAFPSGISVTAYRSLAAEDRRGLLYVGRVYPHKRVPLLVETFAVLRRLGFPESLTIAGSGPDAPAVAAAISRLAPEEQKAIRVLGYVDEALKTELLAKASVLVIPSRREGFPRVVAEAMASGLPVVTTNDEGNGAKDVVEEYGLGVVAAARSDCLSAGVLAVRKDWARFSANALAAAPALDWDELIARVEVMAEAIGIPASHARRMPG